MIRSLYHINTGPSTFNLKQIIDPIFQTVAKKELVKFYSLK